ADAHELTFFAHFDTDLAGHRGGMAGALRALDRLDAFLGGLLDGEGGPLSILLVSDHGNLDDVRTGHTRHPALGAWLGDDAAARPPLDSLLEVRRAILEGIGRPDLPSSRPGDAANLPG